MMDRDREDPGEMEDQPESIELPIDGELDLHTFRPDEIGTLIRVLGSNSWKSATP